jgi:hypothetical protein
LRIIAWITGESLPNFAFQLLPETRMGPKRPASTGSMPRTRSAGITTNSRGQTQEEVEAEEQSRIADDHQNLPNDDHHNDDHHNNLDIGRGN